MGVGSPQILQPFVGLTLPTSNKAVRSLSITVSNYKCFGPEPSGFERILPINIIIGRNNSGKSSLIDVVEYCLHKEVRSEFRARRHGGKSPRVLLTHPISENELRSAFPENRRGGNIPGQNHWVYGRNWIGHPISWTIDAKDRTEFVSVEPLSEADHLKTLLNAQEVLNNKRHPLEGRVLKRLRADRDVVPESESEPSLEPNGNGATNLIQCFLNNAGLPSKLVEGDLLEALNLIFRPDSDFTDIVVQRLEDGRWEVFLEEEAKDRVALSQSGSGLKTVLLVLANLILVPKLEGRGIGSYVFAFEELENNLHPSLLRRLLVYLKQTASGENGVFLLTTHSTTVIDVFGKDEDAQIVHVRHNGSASLASTATTYVDNRGVLDDLDVRASDVLLSNGVIWVEGPSDRVYLNRWIELWSEGELREGTHYQCMFYGGRLLAHLTADPYSTSDWIQLLNMNRNAAIVIDSDKRSRQTRLNATKRRMKREVEESGGLAWVTRGREIENYIPPNCLFALLGMEVVEVELSQYDDVFDFLDHLRRGTGRRYRKKKAILAEEIAPLLTKEHMHSALDLQQRLDELTTSIRRWNGAAD